MKRVLAASVGLLASAGLLMACSSNDNGDSSPATTSASASQSGAAEVTSGGDTEVQVDGQDLPGLDLNSVSCVKAGGKITIGSGSVGGQQGLGVVMTDADTPEVESLGLVVDGNALAVSNSMGVSVGTAEVSVDGDTYTITGEAQGADMANPAAGMITKDFTIKASCK